MPTVTREKKPVPWRINASQSLDEAAKREARRRGMNLSEFVRYAVSRFLDDYATNNNGHGEGENGGANLP